MCNFVPGRNSRALIIADSGVTFERNVRSTVGTFYHVHKISGATQHRTRRFYLSYVRTPRTLCQLGTFIPFILILSTDDPWLSVIPLTIYCDHTYVTFRMHPSCSKEGNPLPYSGHKTEVKTVTVPEAS